MFPCPCILGAWIGASISPYFSFFLLSTFFTSQSGSSSLVYNFQCFQMFPSQAPHSGCFAISATCIWEPYSVSLPNRSQIRAKGLCHWPNQRHYHDCRLVWPILWLDWHYLQIWAPHYALSRRIHCTLPVPFLRHYSSRKTLQVPGCSPPPLPEALFCACSCRMPLPLLHLLYMWGGSSVKSTSNTSLCPPSSKQLNSSQGRD